MRFCRPILEGVRNLQKIKIEGMHCQHCTAAVAKALQELGLTNVEVSLEQGMAQYEGNVAPEAVKAAIEDLGFDVA